MSNALTAFFGRHWHGQIAVLPTLLLTLIGLRLLLSWLSRLRPPDWPLILFAAISVLSLLILVWQVIGAIRALRRDASDMAMALGIAACLTAFVLFLVAELDGYASRAADIGGLPPVLPLPVTGTTLEVTGTFNWPLYKRFCTTLQLNPDLETVSLSSHGGLIPVARAMAARILENGLDTQATGLCASACALTFMAGTNRLLGADGALGFHGYALLGYVPVVPTKDEEARDREWLLARGVDDAFISKIFSTNHDALWRPDAEMLRAAGILTNGNTPPPAPDHPLGCAPPLPGQAASP